MLLVYVTFPNVKKAAEVGEILVKEKLATCVNVIPEMKSIYIWENELCKDDECILLAKIRDTNYQLLENRIKELHPYELPAIFAVKVERGLKEFLEWVER